MIKFKITFPCSNHQQKQTIENEVRLGLGSVEEHKICFKHQELTLYVCVEVENEKRLQKHLRNFEPDVMFFSSSRGI